MIELGIRRPKKKERNDTANHSYAFSTRRFSGVVVIILNKKKVVRNNMPRWIYEFD